jgi:hypothetical protein
LKRKEKGMRSKSAVFVGFIILILGSSLWARGTVDFDPAKFDIKWSYSDSINNDIKPFQFEFAGSERSGTVGENKYALGENFMFRIDLKRHDNGYKLNVKRTVVPLRLLDPAIMTEFSSDDFRQTWRMLPQLELFRW